MLEVNCPKCGREYKLKDSAAGRSFGCRQCDAIIAVPGADDEFQPVMRPRSAREVSAAKKKKKKADRRQVADAGRRRTLTIVLSLVGGGMLLLLICCGGSVLWIRSAVNQVTAGVEVPEGQTFEQWRDNFQTHLSTHGPAPQDYDHELPPPGVEEVRYPSAGRQLMAWVATPDGPGPHPALLYCHGGFAFGASDLDVCQPFLDAGYVVMAPTWRGENGNPGDFELFFGEVDDARAAAQWLAKQPGVDTERIYAFGHSVGGGITAVLSLLEDVPVQITGSSGGIYDQTTFLGWSDIVPFENTPGERSRRLLLGNIEYMQRPHIAYVGGQDVAGVSVVEAAADEALAGGMSDMFEHHTIAGDHFTSLDPAMAMFLGEIERRSQ